MNIRSNNSQTLFLALSAVSLLAGGLVYVVARPRHLLLFWAADQMGMGHAVDTLRTTRMLSECPEWTIYSLPGGLWSLSYILVTSVLTQRLPKRMRVPVCGIIPLTGMMSEIFQATGWLPGTYDVVDLFCYATPYLLYLFTQLKTPEKT